MASYAELQVTTNFSFLRGASSAQELAVRAAELGIPVLGVADHNTLAGVVRMHSAVVQVNEQLGRKALRLLVGARLVFTDASPLLAYPMDRAAYGGLAQLLTDGKRRTEKGECKLTLSDLLTHGDRM